MERKHSPWQTSFRSGLAICFDFQVTLRFAELSGLRKEDYKDGKICIRTQHLLDVDMNDDLTFSANRFINADHVKGNTEHGFRTIPLNDTAKDILERAITLNPSGEYIFMFEDKQLSVSTFNARLRRYCKELGIRTCGLTLRYATDTEALRLTFVRQELLACVLERKLFSVHQKPQHHILLD